MHVLRSKPLLIAALFLAIILQVLTPFLHAHTGASSQHGLHLHVDSMGFESANASKAGKALITTSAAESPEVGVPTSRLNDQFELVILNCYVLFLFALVYATYTARPIPHFFSLDRFAYQRYAQSSPPLSLAPPLDL
ncbi:MAG: hypothetical protein B7Y05_17595 [Polynucleobacter sp. 24-46-87]|jgi:predicted Na+-dependent transporter|nr:MAG: hypothetical protein B7Z19_06045 [Polynucleobacter sp. 32-46-5]OZA10124.1 MAG: hypothetical protein B7Y05_17595 [Polynucleobacter sp. 24-46-87]OZA39964.1 MAG: hypothetical protein B7X83_04765 [Polynucleobacter sp. 17-46-58]OZB46844.1 MAG: hypothetical protein B7X60_07475 [Polynucleobacter sp. 39-45-136]HQT21410.1 hypothetical protein [Polynucleobacter sp.]